MNTKDATYTYALRLGDDALILSHRLSELCGKGPILEEDLAQTNIALDMIGRAQALLKYASDCEGKGRTEDDIAYRRAENNYYNHLLAEQPNGDFAHTIARQLFLSVFEYLFYTELEKSRDHALAAIASKTVKEIRYHMQHAVDWTLRLGDGTEESHQRMQTAINDLWMYTGELFEMDEVETHLMRDGVAVDLIPLRIQWQNDISEVLSKATLRYPDEVFIQSGGRKGIHTEYLGHILAEMQYLQRTYPDAIW